MKSIEEIAKDTPHLAAVLAKVRGEELPETAKDSTAPATSNASGNVSKTPEHRFAPDWLAAHNQIDYENFMGDDFLSGPVSAFAERAGVSERFITRAADQCGSFAMGDRSTAIFRMGGLKTVRGALKAVSQGKASMSELEGSGSFYGASVKAGVE